MIVPRSQKFRSVEDTFQSLQDKCVESKRSSTLFLMNKKIDVALVAPFPIEQMIRAFYTAVGV